jgi:uncharacterized protein YdeI (YjbR/CyaY-like superfamily)
VTEPTFFPTAADWRAWLERNHAETQELWVGFYKRLTGRPSITWPESVDEALCFGWIDGVRKSIDESSYVIRFTPRRSRSNWSAVNIKRAQELIATGRMQPAGLRAFEQRQDERSAVYAYEQRHSARLDEADEQQLRSNAAAWRFFQAQPPSYQKAAAWWIISAKQEATRRRRLATLIEDSANGRTVGPLTRPKKAR